MNLDNKLTRPRVDRNPAAAHSGESLRVAEGDDPWGMGQRQDAGENINRAAKVQGGTCIPINSWNHVLGQEGEKYNKKGTERQVFRVEGARLHYYYRREEESEKQRAGL